MRALELALTLYPAVRSLQLALRKPRKPSKISAAFSMLVDAAEDLNIINEDEEEKLLKLSDAFVEVFTTDSAEAGGDKQRAASRPEA